jgi:hypothetical protein
MTGPTLRERLRDAGLSAWELGDLLGIHPHLVSDPHPLLTGRPVQVLIEIARRLDIHPADLVPELEPLLSHRRQTLGEDLGGRAGQADALIVLTALATARARCRPTSSPAPWAGSCRAPRPPSPPPRTTPIWAARWRCGASRPKPGPSRRGWTSSPRRSAAPCATPPAPPSSATIRPASCSPRSPSGRNGKAATTPACGHNPAGPLPRPRSRKPA